MGESFRACGSKLPGGSCLIVIGTEGKQADTGNVPGLSHLGFVELGEETCKESVTQGGAKELALEGLF